MVEQQIGSKDAPYIRFFHVDVLRGFAVLGIYWINIFIFALPGTLGDLPVELNDASILNSAIAIFSQVYVEGSMRALFSMLFGASALIFLDEARLAVGGLDLVDRYYRRTLFLILFGLIHAYLLLWPYDVLYAYGLFGLFLFPLRKLSVRALLICGVLLLMLGDLHLVTDTPDTNTDTTPNESNVPAQPGQSQKNPVESVNKWSSVVESVENNPVLISPDILSDQSGDEESLNEIRASIEIDTYRSGYTTIFKAQREVVEEKQSTTIYKEYIFDIGGMMLLGMALWKLGLLSGQLAHHVYLILTLTGYILGAATRFAIAYFGLDSDTDPLFSAYNVGRLLITLGHIGLVGLLCYSSWFKFATRLLANVGRMALTNYIMQTIISIILFYGIGFALYAEFQRYQVAMICVGIWLFQIVYSSLWLNRFKHGPLEWLWRSMIYKKMQSIRKTTPVV